MSEKAREGDEVRRLAVEVAHFHISGVECNCGFVAENDGSRLPLYAHFQEVKRIREEGGWYE